MKRGKWGTGAKLNRNDSSSGSPEPVPRSPGPVPGILGTGPVVSGSLKDQQHTGRIIVWSSVEQFDTTLGPGKVQRMLQRLCPN